MPNYRRATFPGGYYFFTVVTHRRRKLFLEEKARACLRDALNTVQDRRAFENIALCLMPDHLHCVWKLPSGDAAFSYRWALIKSCFTRCIWRSAETSVDEVGRESKRESVESGKGGSGSIKYETKLTCSGT
jgi:putative transposase